jgi:hypothetical protein
MAVALTSMIRTWILALIAVTATGYAQTPAQIEAHIVCLEKTIAAQSAQIVTLQKLVASNQATALAQINALGHWADTEHANDATGIVNSDNAIAAVQRQVNLIAANPALALGPFVTLDPNPENGVIGPNLVLHGVNVHIVSGSGATDDHGTPTGLGNLIVGYSLPFVGTISNSFVKPDFARTGSHNLIIGDGHGWKSTGCVLFGSSNFAWSPGSSVLGGTRNFVQSLDSSIVGGANNVVEPPAQVSTILGGDLNYTGGAGSSIVGGVNNSTSSGSDDSVVLGGRNNVALTADQVLPQ